jgi:hypothetical protein
MTVDTKAANCLSPSSGAKVLRNNYWRLRGVRTTSGDCTSFKAQSPRTPQDILPGRLSEADVYEIRGQKLAPRFEKSGVRYVLSNC